MAKVQYFGTGRRKTSVARVRLLPGDGKFMINGRTLDDFFGGLDTLKMVAKQPLTLTGTENHQQACWLYDQKGDPAV